MKAYQKTEKMFNVMRSFAEISRGYGKLTDMQAAMWDRTAKLLLLRSMGRQIIINDGRSLYVHINMNLYEIGEPFRILPPEMEYPQIYLDINFKFVNKSDIVLNFNPKINEDTKIIISATDSLRKISHRVSDSKYKKFAVIGSNFASGDSLINDYLETFGGFNNQAYKICFKYREVNKKSGISNFARTYPMYLSPEI